MTGATLREMTEPLQPPPFGSRVSPPGPPAASAQDHRTRPLWQGALGGGVLVVVLVGVLIAVGAMHFGSGASSTAKVDKTPIELPDRLGAYQDEVAAAKAKGGSASNIDALQARLDKVAGLTTDVFQKAYGGAAAAVRTYSSASLEQQASVIAVRSGSPGLTDGVVQDAASLGLAVPFEAIARFGEVSCIVHQQKSVPAGQKVDPQDAIYSFCERTGPGLTVIATGSSFNGDSGRAEITGLVDAAFEAISGR